MPKLKKSYIGKLLISLKLWLSKFWHKNIITKILSVLILFLIVITLFMYGIAQWYIRSEKSKPLILGTSFIPDYASSLGLNPKQTMDALIGINIKHFRLTSYWSDVEPIPNQYDFSQLDWEFQKAQQAHAKIILSVGLRQPRWPECHIPNWVNINGPISDWQPQLIKYIGAVVERYKNSPSLDKYQLENEFFLKGFGQCTNFDRNRLIAEYNYLKILDPSHQIIVGRSNNAIGYPVNHPLPDAFSISVYKRVWDATVTHRYLEYPYPAWYYGWLAGSQKILTGKDMIISEMQAEAWAPNLDSIQNISLAEQNKSLNPTRLNDRFNYAKATGMREIYMWGSEYWYYRKVVLNDPSLWQVAQKQYQ